MHFNKKPLTVDEHIKLLQSRGLSIENLDTARQSLSHINYYRLSGYWLPFEADRINHRFKVGTKFEDVLNLYDFDRKLRLKVLNAIEYIEVSLRRQWAYFMSMYHGSHSYLDSNLARNLNYFNKNLNDLKKVVEHSQEVFIKHYKRQYISPELPPVWSVCEIMSLGLLSKWFKNLKPRNTRKAIAQVYKLNEKFLASFLSHLTIIRNICAHHSRLWNRKFTVVFQAPKNPKSLSKNLNLSPDRRLYNTLVILVWMLNSIVSTHLWSKEILDLVDLHRIDVTRMGFPENYRSYPIWNP